MPGLTWSERLAAILSRDHRRHDAAGRLEDGLGRRPVRAEPGPISRRAVGRLTLAALGALLQSASGGVAVSSAATQSRGWRTLSEPSASRQRTTRTGALGPDG